MNGPTGLVLAVKRAAAALLCSAPVGRWVLARHPDGVPLGTARVAVPPDDPHAAAALYWGVYESAERRFIAQYLPSSLDVVELGSHFGAVAATVAERLAPGRRLQCVEANPALVPWLERTLQPYRQTHRIDVVCGAVTDAEHDEVRVVPARSPQGISVVADGGGVRTPAVRLRDLAVVTSGHPWALVCDIEGAEAAMLIDEPEALRHCHVCIAEFHDVEHRGIHYSPERLANLVEAHTPLRRRDAYGPVFVFLRST